jgi:hypothetical protein
MAVVFYLQCIEQVVALEVLRRTERSSGRHGGRCFTTKTTKFTPHPQNDVFCRHLHTTRGEGEVVSSNNHRDSESAEKIMGRSLTPKRGSVSSLSSHKGSGETEFREGGFLPQEARRARRGRGVV